MEEPQLSPNEAYSLMVAYFNHMRTVLGKISPAVNDQMVYFLLYVEEDPATPPDWKRCYIKTSRKPFSRKAFLTLQEAFSVMVTFVATYFYEMLDEIFELSAFLNAMRSHPELYKDEWALWEEMFRGMRKRGVEEMVR